MRYHINAAWYQKAGRSLELAVWSRQCPDCRAKPVPKPKDRKGKRPVTPWEQMMANIAKECSKANGYLSASTPVMEAVFRLILSRGNRLMEDEEVLGLLEEGGVLTGRNIRGVEGLKRLLESDNHYGVAALE